MNIRSKDISNETNQNNNSIQIQTIDFNQDAKKKEGNDHISLIPLKLFRSLNNKSKRERSQNFEIINKSSNLRYMKNDKNLHAKFRLRNPKNFQNLIICKTINNTARTKLEFDSKNENSPIPIIQKKIFDEINKMFANYKILGSQSNNSKRFSSKEGINFSLRTNMNSPSNTKVSFRVL